MAKGFGAGMAKARKKNSHKGRKFLISDTGLRN